MALLKFLPAFLALAPVGDASAKEVAMQGSFRPGSFAVAADPVRVEGSAYHQALTNNMQEHKADSERIKIHMQFIKGLQREVAGMQQSLSERHAMNSPETPSTGQMEKDLAALKESLDQYQSVQAAEKGMTDLAYEGLEAEVARLKKAVAEVGHVAVTLPTSTNPPARQLSYAIPTKSVEEDAAAEEGQELKVPIHELGPDATLGDEGADQDAAAEVPIHELQPESAFGDDGADVASARASLDVDTQMPFGELAPFGREDTARELTEASIHESDEMVDQIERAEVAEEKRAAFRALTRLRGAAITSFDGVARSQTGNIDAYAAANKFRGAHPLHHLAQEESDVSSWAFPSS